MFLIVKLVRILMSNSLLFVSFQEAAVQTKSFVRFLPDCETQDVF